MRRPSISIPGGEVSSVEEGQAVVVDETTTFTLTATNAGGSRTESVTVYAGPPRPNIVVILIDDMGRQDSSEPFHVDQQGRIARTELNHRYRTPQMERMARQGKKFTTCYAMSVCSPSRTCLMTGLNSVGHGMTDWSSGQLDKKNNNKVLNSPPQWLYKGVLQNEITLTRLLHDAGYRTLLVGKTHWGTVGNDPTSVHFTRASGYANGSDKLNYFNIPGLAKYKGTGLYVTEALTREMNTLIEEAVLDDVPFYAYLSHFAVHTPHQLDPRFQYNYPGTTGKALAYCTMIEGIDKSLGDVLDKLEALGVAEETLVVFVSDNGSDAPIGEDNSLPLRGKKGTKYEGGSLVPLLIAWAKPDPHHPFQQRMPIETDGHEEDLVTLYDLFPTILHAAGVPFSHAIDGYNLWPYLSGQGGTHRPQEHLLHYPHEHRSAFYTFLRQDDYKLIYNYQSQDYHLYNVAVDGGGANRSCRKGTSTCIRFGPTYATHSPG